MTNILTELTKELETFKGVTITDITIEMLVDIVKKYAENHTSIVIGGDPSYAYPDDITWSDTDYSHNAVQYGRDELRDEQRSRNKL